MGTEPFKVVGSQVVNSTVSTESAGKALATLHRLLADYQSPYEPPHSSYHAADGIDAKLAQARSALEQLGSQTACHAPAEGDTFEL